MKQRNEESVVYESKAEVLPRLFSSSPPPPPSSSKYRVFSKPKAEESVTNREIAQFWRQKRIEEEDHLLAAIKAAARLRARTLTEQEYQSFELSLMIDSDCDETEKETVKRIVDTNVCGKTFAKDKELRVGIKDWWTKSQYAYLNEPAIDWTNPAKNRSSKYIPNILSYQTQGLYPSAIGVF
ncbi:hypothetical protein Fmac_002649 [Flemingia macrophylla]|uniref:Uncharacterized protein n=1 Tax=Flemingia macrophylla TaxID=520843 RepID=A0ABD1NKL2_9FABA